MERKKVSFFQRKHPRSTNTPTKTGQGKAEISLLDNFNYLSCAGMDGRNLHPFSLQWDKEESKAISVLQKARKESQIGI